MFREISLVALATATITACYQSTASPVREIAVLLVIGIIVLLAIICPRNQEGFEKKPVAAPVAAAEAEAEPDGADDVRQYTADEDIHQGVAALKSAGSVADAKAALKKKDAAVAAREPEEEEDPRAVDPNNPRMNAGTADRDSIRGHDLASSSTKKKAGGARIDYAATLDEAYKNLNDMLGSDEMKGLTQDTMKLMEQQKQLFDTMSSMAPMIDSAKSMMQGMDMKQLMNMVGKPV